MKPYMQCILLVLMMIPEILHSSPNDAQRINSPTAYTTPFGWINDPTQLLRVGDYYIICHQCNTYSNQDGNISWCQATSTDLVNWTAQGAVIPNNSSTQEQRFTGTAVLDQNNTSGLGKNGIAPVVAAFTNYFGQATKLPNNSTVAAKTQSQYVAYTLFPYMGKKYEMYNNNPVIQYPPSQYPNQTENFRDPFLMWYELQKKWVMVLALSNEFKVLFYSSSNLLDWTFLSEFNSTYSPRYQWECPGLFQACVANTNESKWVLLISTNPGTTVPGPGINPDRSATGSCVHYHVGDFDGLKFTEDKNKDGRIRYLDEGSDLYAANVLRDNTSAEEGPICHLNSTAVWPFFRRGIDILNRIVLIGWVNNWKYATNRTEEYKGALGFAREICLLKIKDVYRLIQRPVLELEKYVTQNYTYNKLQMEVGVPVVIIGKQSHKFEIFIKGTANFILQLTGNNTEQARIYNDFKKQTICTQKISVDPSKNGALVDHCAEYTAANITILTVIMDLHAITLFCDKGWPTFTELVVVITGKRVFKLVPGSSVSIFVKHSILTIN